MRTLLFRSIFSLFVFTMASAVLAQSKVVVVPMAGDNLIPLQGDIWVAVDSRSMVTNVSNSQQASECTLNYATDDTFGVRFLNNGTASSNCDMVTGVALPDNSTIKEITCTQRASASSAGFVLASQPINGTLDPITMAGIAAPAVNGNIQITSTTSIFQPEVDNETRNYFFRVDIVSSDFSGPGAGANFGFYGCAIRVTPAPFSFQ